MIAAHGVLTLSGFGLKVRVERGHLLIEDGTYFERTEMRLAFTTACAAWW